MDMKWLNFSRKIPGEWEPKPTPSKIKVKGNKFAQNISVTNTLCVLQSALFRVYSKFNRFKRRRIQTHVFMWLKPIFSNF